MKKIVLVISLLILSIFIPSLVLGFVVTQNMPLFIAEQRGKFNRQRQFLLACFIVDILRIIIYV